MTELTKSVEEVETPEAVESREEEVDVDSGENPAAGDQAGDVII